MQVVLDWVRFTLEHCSRANPSSVSLPSCPSQRPTKGQLLISADGSLGVTPTDSFSLLRSPREEVLPVPAT